MSVRSTLASLTLGLALCGPAVATEVHDILYFMRSPQARHATLKLCNTDRRFMGNVECMNAADAEDRLYRLRIEAQLSAPASTRSVGGISAFQTPSFYAANRIARRGVLATCRNHPGLMFSPIVCANAAQGETLDAGRN